MLGFAALNPDCPPAIRAPLFKGATSPAVTVASFRKVLMRQWVLCKPLCRKGILSFVFQRYLQCAIVLSFGQNQP
jgi:hypothetical protein